MTVGGRVVIAGLGNEYRRDDGVGPLVARRAAASAARPVEVLGPLSDPLELLGRWDGASLAVVVDAVQSGSTPGTLRVVELDPLAGDGDARPATSTHGIDLVGVVRLAVAVDGAPRRVVVVGIEGRDFGRGVGLTPDVAAAVPAAVGRVVELVEGCRPCA